MDYGHKKADDNLRKLEKKLKSEYQKAYKEMKRKADDYFYNFDLDDLVMQRKLKYGEITKKEYYSWRKNTMTTGEQWIRMSESLAKDCQNVNKIAAEMINDHAIDVYALNFNYGTFEIEKGALIDTSFTLYDRSTVKRLLMDNPDLLPKPGKALTEKIKEGEAKRWTKKQVQSVATQSILQGESIPKIAKRVAKELGESNLHSAIRNARTMTTAAENAGRVDSYKRAEEFGVEVEKVWLATLDGRTRQSHREMDGEHAKHNEEFSNGLEHPGDPNGDASEVYNCRCTLVAEIVGVDFSEENKRRIDRDIGEENYEEWKRGK